ncbi:MAG: CBS domain-containing protein [Alphaproteobacteria bacterium]
MKIGECMTRDVQIASPSQSIKDAAHLMAEIDVGALPVAESDKLVGMITDRDISVRAIARGLGPDTKVRDVMSSHVLYCFEDQDVDDVAHNMGDVQVRRLPVLSREKRLVGIVSLADLARPQTAEAAAEAMVGISKPGGPHSQSADGLD